MNRFGWRSAWLVAKRYHSTASADEMKHFAQLADAWWDVQGPQRILHKMNLLRMDYIQDTLQRYSVPQPGYSLDLLPKNQRDQFKENEELPDGLNVLDVGCGGGILAESLARLPQTKSVTGIDMTPEVLQVAKQHMQLDPVLSTKLEYHHQELASVDKTYDIVTMFEMLEHVDNPSSMLRHALDKVNPGGWVFLSTINRTPVSWFTTIFMGEDVLKIVPKGTHTYSKYINEHELREWVCEQDDVEFVQSDGCIYIPAVGWKLTNDKSIGNYLMAIKKRM